MTANSATSIAYPNIAFIKYWGNRDEALRLPVNGSISMNLAGLTTRTRVTFNSDLTSDSLVLNNETGQPSALLRVSHFLDNVRSMAGISTFAAVESENNFPTGAGVASSAAAFSALAIAASAAAGLNLDEPRLSRLARLGSGSACRSIPDGFVEWQAGETDMDSYAVSIAPSDHWKIADCIAIIESSHKPVGSTAGHATANTSLLQAQRVADATRRLDICRNAVIHRDFDALAHITELDSNLMHAVMMTSTPPLFYWAPASLDIMKKIPIWRQQDSLPVCYTLDAGPNVHVICNQENMDEVCKRLKKIPGVTGVLTALPGGPAYLQE